MLFRLLVIDVEFPQPSLSQSRSLFPAMQNACHAAACESALACSQVSKVHTDARMKRLSDVSGVAKLERLFHVVASSGAGRFDGLIMRSTARESNRQSTSPTEWLGLRGSEQGTKEESVRGASCQGIDHDLLYIQFMPICPHVGISLHPVLASPAIS